MENVQQPSGAAHIVAGLTPQTLALASLVAAGILLALFLLFRTGKAAKQRDALLIVGPSDAGKTAICFSLAYGETPRTHTSLQTNTAVYSLLQSKRTIRIVDVPGHTRLRDQFQNHITNAKAVAFVVDANSISRNGATVAEHLHHVLHAMTSLPPSQSPPLLILAHKVDLLRSLSSTPDNAPKLAVNRVKTILERELEKRRISQSNSVGIEGLGEEGVGTELGGLDCSGSTGNVFKFDDWEGGNVKFFATSLQIQASASEKREDGLAPFKDWLDDFCNSTR
ncbi:hypothetical protein AX14_008562 [Amanita brunnescens Koide BX004]|nr:hypothetical protein AX14_008562 [Amanita brunnescens Koide BX004]